MNMINKIKLQKCQISCSEGEWLTINKRNWHKISEGALIRSSEGTLIGSSEGVLTGNLTGDLKWTPEDNKSSKSHQGATAKEKALLQHVGIHEPTSHKDLSLHYEATWSNKWKLMDPNSNGETVERVVEINNNKMLTSTLHFCLNK